MSLTLLVALVLGVVGLLARRTEGSWIAPAPLLAAFWTPILFVAGLTFATLDALTSSALYVLAAVTAVWIGSMLGHGFDPPLGRPARLQNLPLLRTLLLLSLMTGVIEIIVLFVRGGYSAKELFSLTAIIQVTITNRSALFNGLQQSAGEWTVFLVLYTSTLLGGVLFRLRRTRADIALSLSAPVLLWMVFALYGSRIGVLFGGAYWVGAYLTTSALVVDDSRIFTPRGLLRTLALTCVLFLGFSIVTQGIRSGQSMPEGWRGAFADGFDYPAAMGIWMDQRGFVGGGFTAGARTFARVAGVVGITASPLPSIQVEFTTSNIYTVFRDVIEDFGTIGGLVFFASLGWLGRVLFTRARAGRLAVLAPLAALYGFLLTTPADSIFFYTVSIAALVVFAVYVAIALLILRRRRAAPLAAQPVVAV
jgi:hypothetical protein